ncbi:MAG TPA: hypothetical protein VN540_07480 [Clostridia bacterium]|nr:hypothetical protein [Clostridia bacterium]
MKKHLLFRMIAVTAALLFILAASGCEELPALTAGQTGGVSDVTQAPFDTAAPEAGETPAQGGVTPMETPADNALTEADGVTIAEKTVLYPEDATEENAQFRLDYALPVFGDAFPANAAMNEQISLYEEELLERVSAERLPYADAAGGGTIPYTRVECRAEQAGPYVNVYLYEFTSFGEGEEMLPRILVLGPDGARESFASVTGIYDVEAVAAQQVFNLIDANRSAYFGDITLDDIPNALDLYAGFFVTEDGYGLVAAPGTLAPEGDGMLVFLVDRSAFYPDVVGTVISAEEYEAIRGPLDTLVSACGMDYAGFDSSAPGAFIATAFMTLTLTTGAEGALYVPVSKADYEETYLWYFSGALPTDFAQAGDGTYFDGAAGNYMLPVHPHGIWSFRIDEAVRTDTGLVLYGMILYGVPGTADSGELCAATVTLTASGESPIGFRFAGVEMR